MKKKNITELVGNTPIIRLRKIEKYLKTNNHIFIKMEKNNPTGSVKDRPVLEILKQYKKDGLIKRNSKIVEATSGNTGISLSAFSNYFGYKAIIFMPESMSIQRRNLMLAYGAELHLVKGGMSKAEEEANEYVKTHKNSIRLNQFNNENNYLAHFKYTGPEIIKDLKDVDYIFLGFGSGGTITGISKFLKSINHKAKVIGLEPEESPLLTKHIAGPHLIQGIGANFIPSILDTSNVEEINTVKGLEAIEWAKKLNKIEGIFVGISSGASLLGAINYMKKHNLENKNILVFALDTGERYSWN